MNGKQRVLLRIFLAIIFVISGVVQFVNQDILMGVLNLVIAIIFGGIATKAK